MKVTLSSIALAVSVWKAVGVDVSAKRRRTIHLNNVDVQNSQLMALRDLFEATNAVQSGSSLNWFRPMNDSLHSHYCHFTGVACDNELFVITLDLDATGLSGTIPDSIHNLKRLRRLKVWKNSHIGTIPSVIGQLTELRSLILGQNNFVGTIPAALGYSFRMRHLLLQSNDLTGTIPASLCQLSDLRKLDLSSNSGIIGEIPNCLGDLANLTNLRIRNSGLSGRVPTALCELSSYGCDGVACGAGSYQHPDGRQWSNSTPCIACLDSSNVIGKTSCVSEGKDMNLRSMSPSTDPSASPSAVRSPLPTRFPSASPSATATTISPGTSPTWHFNDPTTMSSSLPTQDPTATPSIGPTEGSWSPSDSPSSVLPITMPSHLSLSPSEGPYSSSPSTRPPSPVYVLEGSIQIPSNNPSQSYEQSDHPSMERSISPTVVDPSPAPTPLPSCSPIASAPETPVLSTFVPSTLRDVLTSPSPTELYPFASPSSEPTTEGKASPSLELVIGRLQGEDTATESWAWGVLATIFFGAVCCLIGVYSWSRRQRRESVHGSSAECPPDLEFSPTLTPEPVDPFSFPERDIEQNTTPPEADAADVPDVTCVEYRDETRGDTSSITCVRMFNMDIRESPPDYTDPVRFLPKSCVELSKEFKMQVTSEGVEFVSANAPVAKSENEPSTRLQQAPRTSAEEPTKVSQSTNARSRPPQVREQDGARFLRWIPVQESSSTDMRGPLKPSQGSSETPPVRPFYSRRKWLPVHNSYAYDE